MYEMQSFRSSVNEQLTSAGEETLRVLEKQHQYLYDDVSKLKHVRVFVTHRLQAASQVLCDLFQREMDELHTLLEHYNTLLLELRMTTADQCVESSLQVKMSSPVPSRSVSVKQELEDHLYLNFANLPKGDVSPELQERRPSLVQEEPEPPQINDKREELLQRQEEEAAGSTMRLLAMKSEEGGENGEAEPLASTSTGHMKTQVDVEGCGALQPTSDDQLLHSHRYATDTEYSDEWEETREDQSGQSYYLSNELSQDPMSAAQQIPSLRCHTGETPVSCTVCGKQFAFGGRLMRHMRTHTGERPFSCTVCGKSFSQSEILKRHVKIHTDGKIFNCPVCGKSFNRTGNLKTHMRIHTGEKPFHCTVCGKRFTLKGHLKTHMRIHTGEKPFTCPVCCKGFVQKIGLERHMGHHTGDYRFL